MQIATRLTSVNIKLSLDQSKVSWSNYRQLCPADKFVSSFQKQLHCDKVAEKEAENIAYIKCISFEACIEIEVCSCVSAVHSNCV